MIKELIFISPILLSCIFSPTNAQSVDPNLGIIPAPAYVRVEAGQFDLHKKEDITILYGSSSDEKTASLFHDFLKKHYDIDLPVEKKKGNNFKKSIVFSSVKYKRKNKESYDLKITPSLIHVSGEGPGLFYGLQSLMQIFPLKKGSAIKLPCVEVADSPRYQYRGMMQGVSYHFFPVKDLQLLIDLMAEYKLNILHLHLTDDQGWRIEIKRYPLLTKIGAWRKGTQIGHNGDEFDDTPYGGYYTQDEMKELVKYAQARYITIIPEIDMPGHSSAALASYPWLGCDGDSSAVPISWGVFDNIYCPTDSTFQFLENVLTEVMDIFPSHYIHIGGDEVPKDSWEKSAFCQRLMKKEGLRDEDEVQSYFIKRIEQFVNSKGREIIGWDEILDGGLAPNAIVQSWHGSDGGIAAAKQKHDVIMSARQYVYFDYLQGEESQEPIAIQMAYGGYNPLKKVYSYNPTPAALTAGEQKYILGVEACVWTEYMPDFRKVEYMILPRMMALSEIAWTPLNRKNYDNFHTIRLPEHLAKLDTSSILYRVPETIGIKDDTLYGSKFTFHLQPSVNGAKIYYTLDGFKPDRTTFIYKDPLIIIVPKGQERILKTMVITPSGKNSNITTTILNNKQTSKKDEK